MLFVSTGFSLFIIFTQFYPLNLVGAIISAAKIWFKKIIVFLQTELCLLSLLSLQNTSPKSEPALELHSRAAPSVEAYQCSVGPETGRNSRERRIKKTASYSYEGLVSAASMKHLKVVYFCLIWPPLTFLILSRQRTTVTAIEMDDYTLAPSGTICIQNGGVRAKLRKLNSDSSTVENENSPINNETMVVIEIGSRTYLSEDQKNVKDMV